MQLVIADTSPINYLILIGRVEVLPRLFDRVILPTVVEAELTDDDAPPEVRKWMANLPAWLEIHVAPLHANPPVEGLDEGETAAIALAEALHADLLLIDERKGFRVAKQRGLVVTGTLGVLDLAAASGLLDFAEAIGELKRTNFRIPTEPVETLLAKYEKP